MGRPKKPRAIEKAEGYPGKRKRNDGEPDFDRILPECPSHLNAVARAKWDELGPILLRAGLMTEADQISLANLCQAYATMAGAQELLNKTQLVIQTKSGYLQQSPLFSIITTSMELITRLCREFGLTPSSRARLSVGAEKETDLLDDALFGKQSSNLRLLPKRD